MLLFSFFYAALVRGDNFSIDTLVFKDTDDFYAYKFPYIIGKDSSVAKLINQYLQSRILGNEKVETDCDQLFEASRYNDSIPQSGYTSIDYTIGINNKKVFSVVFHLETFAAYPESNKGHYNFDSKSGEIIELKEIFTQEGLAHISQKI